MGFRRFAPRCAGDMDWTSVTQWGGVGRLHTRCNRLSDSRITCTFYQWANKNKKNWSNRVQSKLRTLDHC